MDKKLLTPKETEKQLTVNSSTKQSSICHFKDHCMIIEPNDCKIAHVYYFSDDNPIPFILFFQC